jgi:hypothetical protein
MMKLGDYIFWFFLGLVAVFYLTIGNKMHEERYQMIYADVNNTAPSNIPQKIQDTNK